MATYRGGFPVIWLSYILAGTVKTVQDRDIVTMDV